jgi:hypothetical protein
VDSSAVLPNGFSRCSVFMTSPIQMAIIVITVLPLPPQVPFF